MAMSSLHLGAAEICAAPRVLAPAPQPNRRVVSSMSSPQGTSWLIGQCSNLRQLKGMSCGGCSASVKRILEAQPQVKEATVDLATESAVVQIATEPVAASGWEAVKRQLGESLAKHLTSCGFKSSLKEDGETAAPAA